MPDTPAATARRQSGWGTPLTSPWPKQNCCNSTTVHLPAASPALFARDSIIPAGNSFLTSEGRIVGVCASSVGDASGWGKELIALSILNLPVTLSRLFHRVFNKPVEKYLADRGDGCQTRANGLLFLHTENFPVRLSLSLWSQPCGVRSGASWGNPEGWRGILREHGAARQQARPGRQEKVRRIAPSLGWCPECRYRGWLKDGNPGRLPARGRRRGIHSRCPRLPSACCLSPGSEPRIPGN